MTDTMREPSDARVEAVAKALDDLIEKDRDLAERLIEKHLARLALKKRLKAKQALAAADAVLPPQAPPSAKTQRKISSLTKQVQDLKASRDHALAEAERYRKQAQAGVETPPWEAAPSGEATRKLVEQCRDALAEELGAWDIDPPLFHVKEAHDACVAWLSAPAPAAVPAGWMPIETAPKDGTALLLWTRDGICEGSWDRTTWVPDCCDASYDMARAILYCQPTHWMPLPAAPNQKGALNEHE